MLNNDNFFKKNIIDNLILQDINITTDINYIDVNKDNILWIRSLPDKNPLVYLNDMGYINVIKYFVFNTYWLAEIYRNNFQIPCEKIKVIKDGCIENNLINLNIKEYNVIKLCYITSPNKGLNILIDAWKQINIKNCELNIFVNNTNNNYYNFLYSKCKNIKNIFIKPYIPNDKIRKNFKHYHILVHPYTYNESSGLSIIEALSDGLRVISPGIGCIPEISEGWARLYTPGLNYNLHVKTLVDILKEEINLIREREYIQHCKLQHEVYSQEWIISNRLEDWKELI